MTLVRCKPMRNLVSLPNEIGRFFNDFGLNLGEQDTVWSPPVDVSETEKTYEIKAEMPGMDKKDIKVSFNDNVLTLSGEKNQEKDEKKKNYRRMERVYGRFERSFRLPLKVKSEEIKANYRNGVLTVEIPKDEEARVKEVVVS
ncbi:MAG: Hsp20/alpha crystallin family protein [bacterium]